MQQKLLRFLLTFSILVLAFTSCKKDDDEGSTKDRLIGKWTIIKIDYNDFVGGTPDPYTETADPGSYLQLNADGSLEAVTDDTYTGTWVVNDNKVTINENGNPDGPTTFDIKKLTGSELQLYSKEIDGADYYETTIFMTK